MKILTSRRVVALGVVVLMLTVIVTGGQWLWRNGFFEEIGWIGVFISVCLALGLMSALGVLLRRPHKGIIVLWCRRFGKTETLTGARNRWMWALVSEACRGLAHPVTLQDASIQGSQAVGRSVQTPLIISGLLLGIPIWLTLIFWIDDYIESNWLNWFVGLGGLALYIVMFIGIGRLATWVTTSFATVRGDPKAMQRKLRTTKWQRMARREMEVVRCVQDDWEDHVAAMLDVVDLVIIDCTESTKHLSWEIELAQDRLGNESVLLFSPEGLAVSNELRLFCLEYNPQRALDEIEALSQDWGEDVYRKSKVHLGSYGNELASRLHVWIESRKGSPKWRKSSETA